MIVALKNKCRRSGMTAFGPSSVEPLCRLSDLMQPTRNGHVIRIDGFSGAVAEVKSRYFCSGANLHVGCQVFFLYLAVLTPPECVRVCGCFSSIWGWPSYIWHHVPLARFNPPPPTRFEGQSQHRRMSHASSSPRFYSAYPEQRCEIMKTRVQRLEEEELHFVSDLWQEGVGWGVGFRLRTLGGI